MRRVHAAAAPVLAALLAGCAGWAGGGPEVEGKVTLDGAPLPDAEIRFVPGEASGKNAVAYTDATGRYRLPAGRDGVAPGRHRVVVTDLLAVSDLNAGGSPPGAGGVPPNSPGAGTKRRRFPVAYGDATETPLKDVEVKPGKQTLDFALKSKGI